MGCPSLRAVVNVDDLYRTVFISGSFHVVAGVADVVGTFSLFSLFFTFPLSSLCDGALQKLRLCILPLFAFSSSLLGAIRCS